MLAEIVGDLLHGKVGVEHGDVFKSELGQWYGTHSGLRGEVPELSHMKACLRSRSLCWYEKMMIKGSIMLQQWLKQPELQELISFYLNAVWKLPFKSQFTTFILTILHH